LSSIKRGLFFAHKLGKKSKTRMPADGKGPVGVGPKEEGGTKNLLEGQGVEQGRGWRPSRGRGKPGFGGGTKKGGLTKWETLGGFGLNVRGGDQSKERSPHVGTMGGSGNLFRANRLNAESRKASILLEPKKGGKPNEKLLTRSVHGGGSRVKARREEG